MKPWILIGCGWFFFWLSQSLVLANPPMFSPQSVEPFEKLNQEAQIFAQREFKKYWVKKKKNWFTKDKAGERYWQINGLRFNAVPEHITPIDQLNGVFWKGEINFSAVAQRVYVPDKGWTEWIQGPVGSYPMIKKGKTWKILSSGPPFRQFRGLIYSTDSEILKPDFSEILKVLDAPVLSEVETNQYFSELVAGRNIHDQPPRIFSQAKPPYTEAARQHKITGKVVLLVEFRPDGTIGKIEVLKPLGYGLDECAVDAARQIRFQPATKDGVSVVYWSRVEFSWSLN